MNLNKLKDLYYNSPLWIKNIYSKIPYNIRNGSTYREWNRLLSTEFDTEYSLIKLRETLFLAQKFIPYYQKAYSKMGIVGLEIKHLNEINNLPFINKRIIKDNFNSFVNPHYKNSFYVTTGGSSGEPMKFLQSKNVWAKEQAFLYMIFSRLGYHPSILKASFRGAQFTRLKKNTYWHFNPIQNEIQFSPFHLNKFTIKDYVIEFNNKQPQYVLGYPSAIINFIHLIKNNEFKLEYAFKGVFLISENYTKKDIEIIREFFDCSVLSFYGHSERLIIAPTMDELCQVYEVDNRYGFFELISKDNKSINNDKQLGEIVGTSFDNYSMPLIRYKTGDYTHLLKTENNNKIQFQSVEGRWKNEFLEGKNGEKLTLTAINFHSDAFSGIMSYQFVQEKQGECALLLTAQNKISKTQKGNIKKIIDLKIGHALNVTLDQIESPLLSSRGKQLKLMKSI